MTPDRSGGTAGPASVAAPGRPDTSKRLVLARRIVAVSMGCFPVFCVMFPLLGLTTPVDRERGILTAWIQRVDGPLSGVLSVVVVLLSLVLGYLVWRVIRSRIDNRVHNVDRDILLSLVAATAVSLLMAPNGFTFSLMIMWGACVSVAMNRRRSLLALVFGLVVALVPLAVAAGYNGSLVGTVALALAGAMQVVIWLFLAASAHSLVILWDIINEAYAARDAQARLAVTEERLRFSRDLHDLIGHSLSGIAVKSELAARLVDRAPGAAADEMRSVQGLARDALREVRSAVSGYRDVDLDGEIASVRAVLTAAGVRCTVTRSDGELPGELRSLAAWVVREGATNVLRHSTARHCDIVLRREGRALLVEVHNDGASDGAETRFGNGLTGLTERAAAVGGTLSASSTGDGGYLLRALLPAVPGPDRTTAPPARRTASDSAVPATAVPDNEKDVIT